MSVHHHHHHGHGLFAGDERVHDPMRFAMDRPGRFIVAVTMRQVKDRQPTRGVGWGVNDKAAPGIQSFGFVSVFMQHAMRNVLQIPGNGRVRRNVQDADARPALGFDPGVLRIYDAQSIDHEMVFVNARLHARDRH